MKREWKRYTIVALIILSILVIGIGNNLKNDYYVKSFSYNQYQATEGASVIEDENKRCNLWCPDQNTVSGITTQEFALEKGSYTLVIKYTSTSPKNSMVIKSTAAVDSNNKKEIELANVMLTPEKSEVVIPITTNRLYGDTVIKFSCVEGELAILDTTIKSTSPHFTDSLFITILLVASVLICCIYQRKRKKEESVFFCIPFILGLTAIIATFPYFNDFLIQGHDLSIHLARIEGLYYGLLNGEFPIRINPIQVYGYGYAMPIMYPDLFLYIPALLRVCGVSLMFSYKFFIFLLNVATVIVSYQCITRILNSKYAGVIGSIIYTLGTYRLLNIYERAALGEITAMVFLPLIIWGMYEIIKGNSKRWIWAGIGYACVFMSHILTTIMVLFFTVISILVIIPNLWREKKRILHLAYAAGTAIVLTLWSAIPFLSYLRLPFYISDTREPLHDSSVYISQMFSQNWGGGIRGNVVLGQTAGEMPLTLGIILFVGIIMFIIRYIMNTENKSSLHSIGMYMLVMGGIALFMASWIFPWEALQEVEFITKIASKIQFAYRFLMIAGVFLTITATIGIMEFVDNKISNKMLAAISLVLFIFSMSYLEGTLEKETISNKNDTIAINTNDNLYMYQEINPYNWFLNGESIQHSADAVVTISNYIKKGTNITFYADVEGATKDSYFDVPLAYYPGYIAKSEKEKLPVIMSETGMVRFKMPQESGMITVAFKEKPMWIIADIISLLAWIFIVGFAIKKLKSSKVQITE